MRNTRRRLSITEIIIVGQCLAIALAVGFVLFSVGYRSWVTYAGGTDWVAGATWGLIAVEMQAEEAGPVLSSANPTAYLPVARAQLLKTLVPTFTPIPSPSDFASVTYSGRLASTPAHTRPAPTLTSTPKVLAQAAENTLVPPASGPELTTTPVPATPLPGATRPPSTPTRLLPTRTAIATPKPTRLSPTRTFTPTRLPPTPTAPPTPERRQAGSPPTRLVIPSIGVDAPVESVGFKSVEKGGKTTVMWDTPKEAAGFHETSAYPGTVGNTVINGHRDIYGAVFWRLSRVKAGDEIVLYIGDDARVYHVSEIIEVRYSGASQEQRAEHLHLMGYLPEERLTLITCTPPVLATHRLYVIAKPVEEPAHDNRWAW